MKAVEWARDFSLDEGNEPDWLGTVLDYSNRTVVAAAHHAFSAEQQGFGTPVPTWPDGHALPVNSIDAVVGAHEVRDVIPLVKGGYSA